MAAIEQKIVYLKNFINLNLFSKVLYKTETIPDSPLLNKH